ncbi:MAG: FAD-dependent oxidoreductase [Parvibaculaceae bacterium]
MKSQARVVVIGGGVVGCSVAYHLAKAGWNDCVLLERKELTSGSSWHAAGSLFTLTAPSSVATLQKYTRELYPKLEAESGQPIGYHQTGGYTLARSDEEMKKLRILMSRCLRNGIESEFHSLEEARRRTPILNTDGLKGALWEPGKGHVDPASVTQAYAKAARQMGVGVHRETPVTATRLLPSGEWDVETPQGTIRCQYIVNAAGLWAREVAALADIRLPLVPVEHHYLVTETIPEIAAMETQVPTLGDGEANWYLRQEGKGLLLGAYETPCIHWAVDRTPADFGHELLPDDVSRMDENFADAVERVPSLGRAGIKRVINGPMIFSPDLSPLLGPWPGLPTYFCAAGVMTAFNQGGGVGKVIAEWMIEGEPSLDIFAWDVARYGDWTGKAYTKARTKYFYEHRSHRIYPYQQFAEGRPVRTSPIYPALKAQGAVFGDIFGLESPLWFARPGEEPVERYVYERQNWFDAVGEEMKAVREGVGLFETSSYGKIEVSGEGAETFLDRLLANRLPTIGRTMLSPMLSPKGRLIGDFTVSRLEEDRFLLLGSGAMQSFHMRWFGTQAAGDASVRIENMSARLMGLHIAGPRSRELLSRLAGEDVGGNALPFLSVRTMELGPCPAATVVRVSFTGELGYEIYMAPEVQHPLYEAILREGSDLGLRLAGGRALMGLRLEKGFGSWGLEFSPDYSPWATPLSRFVRLSKPDFVGRAAAEAERAGEHPRMILLDVLAEDADATGGEAIYSNGRYAGYTTSGGYGHTCGLSLALGYLNRDFADASGAFEVEIVGKRQPARLLDEPPVDPDGARMRG